MADGAARVIIEVAGVTFRYRAAPALDGASMSVPRGGFVAVIGPNGSGKTTLLRCIGRGLRPQSGAVLLEGGDVLSLAAREVAKRLAVVPQAAQDALDAGAEFTVAEAVLMGRQPHLGRFEAEGPDDWEAVRAALAETGTLDLAGRRLEQLSGGERQRAAIARALAQEPQVLLLDEPTAHLDLAYQGQVLDLLRRLNRQRDLTVLAVMHDLNLAAQYFDSFVLLTRGRVCATGTAEEVLTAANIGRAYGGDVLVSRHPVHRRPLVTVVRGAGDGAAAPAGAAVTGGEAAGATRDEVRDGAPEAQGRAAAGESPDGLRQFAVHVIAGGGAGGRLLGELCRRGWWVSAGALNRGDTDFDRARELGVSVIEAAPFTPVARREHEANRALAEAADAVVVASVPFGPANVINLEAAQAALDRGRAVVLVDETPVAERDYVGGAAAAACARLASGGAHVVNTVEAALAVLERAARGGADRGG